MFFTGCPDGIPHENEINRDIGLLQRDAKIFSNVTIEDDFDDNSLIVILDNLTGGVNKRHDESFFGEFEKEYVQDITITIDNFETIDKNLFRQIFEIKLPKEKAGKERVLHAIRILERIEGILYAGPNYFYYPRKIPNDLYYESRQWYLNDYYSGIQAENAWEITIGSRDVKVGIIDSGIAIHPDLEQNVDRTLERHFSYLFNCNNWYCNDPTCKDTNDTNGHGTAVAGIVGAVGNSDGIVGVCWEVKLVPLKVTFSNYAPPNDPYFIEKTLGAQVIKAINYSRDKGIKILNFSMGQDEYFDFGLHQAISQVESNILFVCAASNRSALSKGGVDFPTMFTNSFTYNGVLYSGLPNIISVSSINQHGDISSNGSNTADESFRYVNIFAPGGNWDRYFHQFNILSTYPPARCGISFCGNEHLVGNIGYHYTYGTSIATPHVTGVAALIQSVNSYLMPYEIKDRILQNVEPYNNSSTSGGRLNAYKAVLAAVTPVNTKAIKITIPAIGVTPTRTIETAQFTGTVEWYPNHATFVDGTNYTATITLKANDCYTLHGITSSNYFTVDGSLSTYYDTSSGKITANMGKPLYGGGMGTQYSPYLIKTVEHLNNIRLFPDKHFQLANDIIFITNLYNSNWIPIPVFSGNFNGAGFKISKILMKTPDSKWGFGLIGFNDGIIRNLVIEGFISLQENFPAGMFAAVNYGTISQCYSQQSVCFQSAMIEAASRPDNYVGGITGRNIGKVELCGNYGSILNSHKMGGIVGLNEGIIDRCFNSGSIIYSSSAVNVKMGGIAGIHDPVSQKGIISCYNYGLIKYGGPGSASTSLQPNIAQIVGHKMSGYFQTNGWSGTVDKGLLRVVGNYDQALYVGDREAGRQ